MLIHSPNKEILFINGQPFQAASQWRIERMHPHRHAAISASQKYRQSLAYLLTYHERFSWTQNAHKSAWRPGSDMGGQL